MLKDYFIKYLIKAKILINKLIKIPVLIKAYFIKS